MLASIQQAIILRRLEERVMLLGRVDETTLSAAYHAAELFIFPLRVVDGDVEGLGMVATEAAAHGSPTVAFATVGVPDVIADGVSGSLVESGNYPLLAQEIFNISTASVRSSLKQPAGPMLNSTPGTLLVNYLLQLLSR